MHHIHLRFSLIINSRIIIGSDWRPETKQGIEGKIDKFRSGRVRDRNVSILAPVKLRSPI